MGCATKNVLFRIDTSLNIPLFEEYLGLNFSTKAIGMDPTSSFIVTATKVNPNPIDLQVFDRTTLGLVGMALTANTI